MERKWWHGKTAYQIYPKSFCDSNGDGVGDIPGIISKLDYLKGLGIDIVWISPIYCSPLADQGYDISNYQDIDPLFGTMADFDKLLAEAKKRDMHIVMDLVVNHCSDEHEWFKKACEDPNGKYGKYFYIQDWHEGDPLPCNWRSYFGGSCWEKLPGHEDKIYFHAFHKKQPDLNWENPEVRRKIYDMMNWWLAKGVAGFRIDAIINIKKKLPFCDYPVDRDDGLSDIRNMLRDADGIMDYLQEMKRETFDKYDAFSIGEVFDNKEEDMPDFIGDNGCFSSMFDFSGATLNRDGRGWYAWGDVQPDQYRDACFHTQAKTEGIGYVANIIENHDEPRGVSRYIPQGQCTIPAKKMLGGLSFMLKGLPFLYQGQEIGMENVGFGDIREIDDISTLDEYKTALAAGLSEQEALAAVSRFSRDNARTPFHWDSSPNAGFTTGTPWLKVNPNYPQINLASQIDDADSVYNFYRQLVDLRRNPIYAETIVYGQLTPYLPEEHNLMAYMRTADRQLLVAGNFQPKKRSLPLPAGVRKVLLSNLPVAEIAGGVLPMEGYQFVILELDK